MLEQARVQEAPPLTRVVVAVDPPASSGKRADNCGIVAAGMDAQGVLYVLEDATVSAARPAQWSRAAIALYHKLAADALVAEVNQGGEMVRAVLNEADPSAPVTMARATRGKYLRAAPVAQLYEQGRVRHVGAFPALEDEMCDFGPNGLSSGTKSRSARRAGLGDHRAGADAEDAGAEDETRINAFRDDRSRKHHALILLAPLWRLHARARR